MNQLSRETILNKVDVSVERHDIPEWGGYVFIKQLSVAERFAYDAARNGEGLDVDMGRILTMTICDESGNLLFKNEDIQPIIQKNYDVIRRLCMAALRFNKMTDDEVEASEKNLQAASSGASSSG